MAATYRTVAEARRSPALARFLVGARWSDACVRADGVEAPGVVMDWVDAPTLGEWLENAHRDPDALERLRGELAALQAALEDEGYVHGDVQAGNLALRDGQELVLLDYDGFRAEEDPAAVRERGHVHFQHPAAEPGAPGPADRFPLLAFDLGLAALAAEPDLFDCCEGENVVWRGDDFDDPDSSPAFARVAAIPALSRAAALFAAACKADADAAPTLADFRAAAGLTSPGPVPGRVGKKGNSAASAAPSAAAPVGTWFDGSARPPHPRGADIPSGTASARARKPGSRAYRGQYPVVDAASLSAVAASVGAKVELVGRVVSVKRALTKYGKPYAFVNFGDWRRDGTKLVYWSEGLEAVGESSAPTEAWEGRWLSATGLVDEPYENLRFGTTQHSITILSGSQVRVIPEAEARRRLAAGAGAPFAVVEEDGGQTSFSAGCEDDGGRTSPAGANAAFVADRFGNVYDARPPSWGRSSGPGSATHSSRPGPTGAVATGASPSRPSNAELLAGLAGGPKATGPAPSAPPRPASPGGPSPASRHAPAAPAEASGREGLPAGCAWAIVAAIAAFIFWAMGR